MLTQVGWRGFIWDGHILYRPIQASDAGQAFHAFLTASTTATRGSAPITDASRLQSHERFINVYLRPFPHKHRKIALSLEIRIRVIYERISMRFDVPCTSVMSSSRIWRRNNSGIFKCKKFGYLTPDCDGIDVLWIWDTWVPRDEIIEKFGLGDNSRNNFETLSSSRLFKFMNGFRFFHR